MFKKIICMVIFMMSIMVLSGCTTKDSINTISPEEETVITETKEARIYEQFGSEVLEAYKDLHERIEHRGYEIVNEWIDEYEFANDYYVAMLCNTPWGEETYFTKVPK